MLENNQKKLFTTKTTKNYKKAINKMSRTQHGCAKIQ